MGGRSWEAVFTMPERENVNAEKMCRTKSAETYKSINKHNCVTFVQTLGQQETVFATATFQYLMITNWTIATSDSSRSLLYLFWYFLFYLILLFSMLPRFCTT